MNHVPRKKKCCERNKIYFWQILRSFEVLLKDTSRCVLPQVHMAESFHLWSSSFAKTPDWCCAELDKVLRHCTRHGEEGKQRQHIEKLCIPVLQISHHFCLYFSIFFPLGIHLLGWNNKRAGLLTVFPPCRNCEKDSVLVISI